MKGIVIKSTGKWYKVEIDNLIYNCVLKGKFKIENKLTNPITSVGLGLLLNIQTKKDLFLWVTNL